MRENTKLSAAFQARADADEFLMGNREESTPLVGLVRKGVPFQALVAPTVVFVRMLGLFQQFIRREFRLAGGDAPERREKPLETRRMSLHLVGRVVRPVRCGVLFFHEDGQKEGGITIARIIPQEREHLPGPEKLPAAAVDLSQEVNDHARVAFGQTPAEGVVEMLVREGEEVFLGAHAAKFPCHPRAPEAHDAEIPRIESPRMKDRYQCHPGPRGPLFFRVLLEDVHILRAPDQLSHLTGHPPFVILDAGREKTIRARRDLRRVVAVPWDETKIQPIAEHGRMARVAVELMRKMVITEWASKDAR
jgi:hypothetical protein